MTMSTAVAIATGCSQARTKSSAEITFISVVDIVNKFVEMPKYEIDRLVRFFCLLLISIMNVK